MIYKCPICTRPHMFGKVMREGLLNCVSKVTQEFNCLGNCGTRLKVTFNPEKVPILFGLFHMNGQEYKSVDVRVLLKGIDSGFSCPKCKAPQRPPLQCIDDCKRGYQRYTSYTKSCRACGLSYKATFNPVKGKYSYDSAELEILSN